MNENIQFPENFDGRFYFTNSSDEDFSARWNGIIYTFPALKTSPLIIPSESAENIQSIRKKFAREWAEREFYKGAKYKSMQIPVGQGESMQTALTYTPSDIEPLVQKCLEPLEIAQVTMQAEPKKKVKLRTDDEGKTVSKVLKSDKESLIGEGTVVA